MSELRRSTYYPENNCLYPFPKVPCPNYPYPLENRPICPKPCTKPDFSIYGNPAPAELYGDSINNDLFYYHDHTPYALHVLTKPQHPSPLHLVGPFAAQRMRA